MSEPDTPDDEHDIGGVVRSEIDDRVWVAVVPDWDTVSGAMGASTSLRRCKAHVERLARRSARPNEIAIRWERSSTGWDAYGSLV